ncbi:MAG: hypothetical protein WAX89_01370 [Alphaproteobacteria bacterium]
MAKDDTAQINNLIPDVLLLATDSQEDSYTLKEEKFIAAVSNDPIKFDTEKLELEVDGLRERLKDQKQDLELKRDLYKNIQKITRGWLFFIAAIICLNAITLTITEEMLWPAYIPLLSFHISDSVMIAIVGTTTATILGLYYVVANYLFPKNGKKS